MVSNFILLFQLETCTNQLKTIWIDLVEWDRRVATMEIRIVTLCLLNITMENGPFIDGLPIKNGDFPWLC